MNKSLRDSELVQLSQDDLDQDDIAAYSATVRGDADNYQTLSEQENENEEKQKNLKHQLAEKKKKLKAMKAKKAKEEKAKKAAAAKKKKAAAKTKAAHKASPLSKKSSEKTESPFPEDEGAMKSYSQAIAQQAENNEPDTPIAYQGESPAEKTVKNDTDEEADKEINDLLLGVSKKKGGLFPGAELV